MRQILLLCLFLFSCDTKTGQGAFLGGAGGAVIGGAVGGGQGALIGAGAGALGGALIGATLDASDRERLDQDTKRHYEAGEPLTVDDVIKMNDAGIEPDKIVGAIQGNRCYPLTSSDVKKLKEAKVSSRVIKAMNENHI